IDTGKKEAADDLPQPIVPSVLVVIENDAPLDRGRLTRLVERGADADVHILWSAPSIADLPAACRSFVSVENATAAPEGAPTPGAPAGATAGQVRLGEHTFPLACETVDA